MAFAEKAVVMTKTGIVSDAVLKIGPGRYDFWLVVDISAMAAGGYRFLLQGADAKDFDAASQIVNLAMLDIGNSPMLLGGATSLGIGRYAIPFVNEISDESGELGWIRLNLIMTDVGPIIFKSWLSREMRS